LLPIIYYLNSDAAETLYNALSPFFKSHGRRGANGEEVETEKQELRDAKALIHGKLIIENIKPKLTGGKRIISDETFKDSTKFKDDIEGSITE
jgi:hypothetical protein